MHLTSLIAGILIILAVLLDAFEAVVLPRRVQRSFRITSTFYRVMWRPWAKLSRGIQSLSRRESFLGYFGPLSLLLLLGLWAAGLIFGFALVQHGGGAHILTGGNPITFGLLLYHSGETFFTLGYGDITPNSGFSGALSVTEAGLGFAFLGIVIGYLPTIYGAFSRREVEISLLDARAGSPPSASEFLVRFGKSRDQAVLDAILHEWEHWSSELLESQISYPPLAFFRSQHSNQSWLGALTTILDVTSLIIAGIDDIRANQAKLTFAIARHAIVDISQVVRASYHPGAPDRLSKAEQQRLKELLAENGITLKDGQAFEEKLATLRALYEPYAQAVAQSLLFILPPWVNPEKKRDNWQSGPWDRLIQARGLAILGQRAPTVTADDHF